MHYKPKLPVNSEADEGLLQFIVEVNSVMHYKPELPVNSVQ